MWWLHPLKWVRSTLEFAPERLIDILLLLFVVASALVLAFAPHFIKTAWLLWMIL